MDPITQKVKGYLQSLDATPEAPLNNFAVSQGIRAAIGKTDEKATGEALYEILAFDLFPRHEGNQSPWGTYFGSMMSGHTENPNEPWEYPSKNHIEPAAIAYWSKRAREVKHPVLAERYADIAFDLARIANQKPDHTLAQLAIDSILQICEQDLVEGIYQRQETHRALVLSLLISDQKRLSKVIDAIVCIDKKIAIDDKPGLWGFAFKWLLLDGYEKLEISEETEKSLVSDLEKRLVRLLDTQNPEPWNVECAITLLLPYYLRKKEETEASRVLLALEDAFRRNERSNSDPLLKVNYLEKLDQLYRQNGGLTGMTGHIERIAKELPGASRNSTESFQEISSEIKIERKEIDAYINSIFTMPKQAGGNPPTFRDIKVRIISHFLGRRDQAAKLAEKFSKKFVFMHIIEQKRISPEGHTEYIVPPYNEDPESHIVSQAFQNIQFSHFFLSEILAKFRSIFTPDEVLDSFEESSLILPDEKEYVLTGLKAYWDIGPFHASQTFLPYTETLVRRLIARAGGITLRPNENGGYSNKTLGTLLAENSELIDKIFQAEVSFYLKVVLTHPLGWNLRNNHAHGIGLNALFRQDIADRLFHILLLLSLVKIEKKR